MADDSNKPLEVLLEEFKSDNESIQFDAYFELKRMSESGSNDLVTPLMKTLKHGNNQTRALSATLLGILRDKRSVDALISALSDDFWDVRYGAVVALGNIGDRRAVDPIRNISRTDPHDRVGGRAGIVLKEIFHA
jgi:HEAT repeat protein